MTGDNIQAHLAAIVDSSDDAIISKNLQGLIESWNRGAEKLFGYTAEEMIGQPIIKLLPEDRKGEEEHILGRLRLGERVDHFRTVRVRKDGQRVDVSVTISPILDAEGKVVGASKVARDMTDRLALEAMKGREAEELEQRVGERTAALEAANREIESFTYTVAHDLRGPIRAIQATSVMLIEDIGDTLDEDSKDLLDRQVQAAQRLSRLIDDLLGYSQLGKTEVQAQDVNLTKSAHEVIAALGKEYPLCTFAIQDDLHVHADRNLMRLTLHNLLENACKFSPKGGPVSFGKRDEAFYVQDRGIGFNMEYAEKAFKPFERLVRNDEYPGTGIGLANVKRVMDKHHGTIWVESFPGEGTTIYFKLP